MNKIKKITSICFAVSLLSYSGSAYTSPVEANEKNISIEQSNQILQQEASPIKSVTSIGKVYGDGEKIAAAAVEYPTTIASDTLTPTDFKVDGQKIIGVYTNDRPEYTTKNVPGKYVILCFEQTNTTSDKAMTMPPKEKQKDGGGHDAPRYSNRKDPDLSIEVSQLEDIEAENGTTYEPANFSIKNTAQTEADIAGFKQYEYTDPKTGYTIPYQLYLPKDYDSAKKYPLLFFIADASANTTNKKMVLLQGNGATIWASPAEQAKHECIILAPDYTRNLIDSIDMLTTDSNTWTKGLTLVSDLLFDVTNRYSVDKNRIYGSGQSQGGMANIAISDKYPDLFAAQYLVACQWNVDEMEVLKDKNLWIMVSEGDSKAYPAMNEATARWEKLGSKVARSDLWDSKSTPEEFDALVKKTENQHANINYSVFQGGNHMYTWSVAYTIEGIRDWLFAQKKFEGEDMLPANRHVAKFTLDKGIACYTGKGIEKDYKKALEYFHEADQYGHPKAGRYIGLCYENGYGVSQDYKKAVEWYQKAVQKGDITSTCYLGHMYEAGLGVTRDYKKALQLYLKSAERGDIIAAPGMVAAGRLYEKGLGVDKDLTIAKKYYEQALNTGYEPAQQDLDRITAAEITS